MSNNTGGPAFPGKQKSLMIQSEHIGIASEYEIEHNGMTLRDWFAGMAMQGICASGPDISNPVIAAEAYALADAMIKQREVGNES